MALNTLKCNHLTPLGLKRLTTADDHTEMCSIATEQRHWLKLLCCHCYNTNCFVLET